MMIMNITVQAILALSAQTNLLAWNRLPHHWNFMLFYTVCPPSTSRFNYCLLTCWL
jgi:hypothetical protein